MPIHLYYAKLSPPVRAVHMCLKQLNLDINIKPLDLMSGEHKKPEFLEINPAHIIPTIVDGDFVLWESRAIMQYLANKYAPNSSLYPSDPKKRAVVDRTLNFDMSYYKSICDVLFVPIMNGTVATERQITNFKNNLKLMDTLIGTNKYVAGDDLTIADFSVLSSSLCLEIKDLQDLNDLPNLKGWYERIQKELPFFEEVNGGVKDNLKKRFGSKTE